MKQITFLILATVCAAPAAGFGADDPGLRGGDPARWDVPNLTAAQRLEGSLKEARNAMADALRDCRASAERKGCEAEARAQYQRDVLAARQQAREAPRQ